MTAAPAKARVGETAVLEIGGPANGGSCVARWQGQVVFVRHALPGEEVVARFTSVGSSFARADAIEVLRASPHRVEAPCPVAGRCGGCDLQHVAPDEQRELKRLVVVEQLRRLAGIDWTGSVVAVEPTLGWRTRMRYLRTRTGALGLRGHRAHDVVALPAGGCRIAAPAIAAPAAPRGSREVLALATGSGTAVRDAARPGSPVVQRALGRDWTVAADGFWQSHVGAPECLVAAVLDGLDPRPGERAVDLYCGVGLFAGALVERGLAVTGIEGDRDAVAHARANVPGAEFLAGDVQERLAADDRPADLVVLDPPRVGAGPQVMASIAALGPRAVGYVSCDIATLARDLATADTLGYRLADLTVFDLFPMTHHVESVAILERR